MIKRMIIVLSADALLLLVAVAGASAQKVDLPQRDRGKLASYERRARPNMPEADLYPHRPPVSYEPGFVAPLTKETKTGRMGVAGWTSPNTPVGSRGASDPDNVGWLGFGFAMEWGSSPRTTITR